MVSPKRDLGELQTARLATRCVLTSVIDTWGESVDLNGALEPRPSRGRRGKGKLEPSSLRRVSQRKDHLLFEEPCPWEGSGGLV